MEVDILCLSYYWILRFGRRHNCFQFMGLWFKRKCNSGAASNETYGTWIWQMTRNWTLFQCFYEQNFRGNILCMWVMQIAVVRGWTVVECVCRCGDISSQATFFSECDFTTHLLEKRSVSQFLLLLNLALWPEWTNSMWQTWHDANMGGLSQNHSKNKASSLSTAWIPELWKREQ